MTTITVTHQRDTLGYVTVYNGVAGLSFRHSYSSTQLRAIAAALTEAADKLEPQPEPKFKVGDRVRSKRIGYKGLITRICHNEARIEAPDGSYYTTNLEDLEPAPEPAPQSMPGPQRPEDCPLVVRRDAPPLTPADTTAWWEAYLAALTGLLANPNVALLEPYQYASDCALLATAAVEARRKMEENQP
jgi:hypothetical protein